MRKKIALVTAASRGIGQRVDAITDIDDRRTLAVNLDGAFFCLRAAIPRMRASGGGRIVNVSSGAARRGGTIGAHYAASKAGMLVLTAKVARDEAARARVRAKFLIGRFGRSEEVATVVRFLCESAPAYLTGECIPLRGGRQ